MILAEEDAVRFTLGSYEGRMFIWLLMQEAGLSSSGFVGEAPLTMAFLAGKRDLGLWVENWVFTAASEMYNLMRREAVERAEIATEEVRDE